MVENLCAVPIDVRDTRWLLHRRERRLLVSTLAVGFGSAVMDFLDQVARHFNYQAVLV